MKQPSIPLDYWMAFKTVVDEGSYALAGDKLNRSQSAISYAIHRLNEVLPRPVLVLKGRKAQLTEEGQVLYRYAEQLIRQAAETEAIAASLAMDFEAEITLAIDVILEPGQFICSFERFSQQYPHTRLRVLETSLSGTTEVLLERKADIVIGPISPVGFRGASYRSVTMMPVAAPDHPLVANRENVSELELRRHRQVVLRDSGTRQERDAGWLGSEQRWTVSQFGTSITLLKSGLVFGFMPREWIRNCLDSGSLCPIPLEKSLDRTIQTYLYLSDDRAAGPATKAMEQQLMQDLGAAG